MENRPRGRRRCRICLGAELDAEGRISPDAIPEFGGAFAGGGELFLPQQYELPYELQRIGPDRSHRSQLPVWLLIGLTCASPRKPRHRRGFFASSYKKRRPSRRSHRSRAIFATHHQFRFTLLHAKDERRGIFALRAP